MWELGAFNKETGMIVREYVLRRVDGPMLKELLDIDDSEYPIWAAQHDIPWKMVEKLAPYVEGDFVADDTLDYELGYSRD